MERIWIEYRGDVVHVELIQRYPDGDMRVRVNGQDVIVDQASELEESEE